MTLRLVPTLSVQPQAEVVKQITDLLVEGLAPQPFWEAAFTDAALRERLAPWLFERRLRLNLNSSYVLLECPATDRSDDSDVYRLQDGVEILGHVMLQKPGSPERNPSTWRAVQVGLAFWPFLFGFESFLAFMALWKSWDAAVADAFGESLASSAIIEALVVRKSRQSSGLGSLIMQKVLDMAGTDTEITLATQLEKNVTFYKKHHFEVVKDELLTLHARARPVRNWFMRRNI